MVPNAYNWWEGNQFRVPGLPVRPTYAPALNNPATSPSGGTAADTLAQLGFRPEGPGGIGEGMGRNEGSLDSLPDVKDPVDMLGRVATGVGMVTGFPGFAMGLAGLAGPTPKTSYGLADLLPGNSLFGWSDMLGGGSGTNGGVPGFDKDTGLAPGVGPEVPVESAPLDPIGGGAGTGGMPGGAVGGGSGVSAPDQDGNNSGLYNKGGKVKKLFGPNPPGPDDGFGGLKRGERVIPEPAVRKLEAKHGPNLFDMAINKGKLPGKASSLQNRR